jgi:hypothetical protein
MPAKSTTGGVTVAEIDALLPRGLHVRRGDIKHAFGFNSDRVAILIADGTFVAKYPFGKTRPGPGGRPVANRAHFLRSQVLAVAKRWEGEA